MSTLAPRSAFIVKENAPYGEPYSPVFKTLEALAEWCEVNATTFGSFRATKEEWMNMLDANFVCHKAGNNIFL